MPNHNQHNADSLQITDRAALARVAGRAADARLPMLPLFQAAAAGRIALVRFEFPEGAWPAASIAKINRPCIVVVGDDPWPVRAALGPAPWRCKERLRRWAAGAIIHGAGGEMAHYRHALNVALTIGRLAFVETDGAHIEAWANAMVPLPVQRLIPHGGVHPVPPTAGDMQ